MVRVNLSMAQKTKKRLEGLVLLTKSETMSDVVCKALSFYEKVFQMKSQGGTIILRKEKEESIFIID